MKEDNNFTRTEPLGYHTYLLEEKRRNSFWYRVQFQHHTLMTNLFSFAKEAEKTRSEHLNALLEDKVDLLEFEKAEAKKVYSSEDEALLALFPERITSFFADAKVQKQLSQETLTDIAHELEFLEREHETLEDSLENIEEDPLLGDMAIMAIQENYNKKELSLEPLPTFKSKEKSSINQITSRPLNDKIRKSQKLKAKKINGNDISRQPMRLAHLAHLNRLEQERALLLLKANVSS